MATATGAGYDFSVGTFSPEGRIFQVEYAQKAVDNGSTALGMVTPKGVLLAVEKILPSKLLKKFVNRRIETVDLPTGLAATGYLPDIRALVNRAREEASTHRETFEDSLPISILAERLALFIHAYTMYASVRPFGISTLLAGMDPNGTLKLFLIDPEGTHYGYQAVAIGKGRQWGRTELEKLDLKSIISADEAMVHAAKIILGAASEASAGVTDKETELEFSWLDAELQRHVIIDATRSQAAVQKARELLAAELQYDIS